MTLPEQAKVESGIAFCAFCIAQINGYFGGKSDNLNVAPADLLAGCGIERTVADAWADMRGFRVEPFTSAELALVARRLRDRF